MKSPVLAYFYPLSVQCAERQSRAQQHGYTLPDETQLCQESTPLYEGHNQPVTYCLGNTAVKNWDDADPEAMRTQIQLATDHGVEGFIFDTYMGRRNGKKVHEMSEVLDKAFLGTPESTNMKFALMSVLGSPRVVLPVPPARGFEEHHRYYDPTKETVETLIDHSARNYWDQDNYWRIGGNRPYLSVFTSEMKRTDRTEDAMSLPDMIEYMKEYSTRTYGIEPYIAGVCLKASTAVPLFERGADAMTGYAFLPDFSPEAAPVQAYKELVDQRIADWHTISKSVAKPYVPPVVVGWDASARGTNDLSLDDVRGTYPFTPIVEGANSEAFGEMLAAQAEFVGATVPEDERYTPITAWNEVTEGAALLPKVNSDNTIDSSYLKVVRSFTEGKYNGGTCSLSLAA